MSNQQGLELSVVLESSLLELVYPPPFEFHYSAFHRERYLADDDYLCGGFHDADLAAHYTVIYHRGTALYGKPVREVFPPVDRSYYVQAILEDVESAVQDITASPVYYTLNLCRVLYYLREGVVSSKRRRRMGPSRTSLTVSPDDRACPASIYRRSGKPAESAPDGLIAFAGDMLERIRKAL